MADFEMPSEVMDSDEDVIEDDDEEEEEIAEGEEVSELEWESDEGEAADVDSGDDKAAPTPPPRPAGSSGPKSSEGTAAKKSKTSRADRSRQRVQIADESSDDEEEPKPPGPASKRKSGQAETVQQENGGGREPRGILKKQVSEEASSDDSGPKGYLAGDMGEGYKCPSEEDTDSSLDEQGYRNRIGNIPLKWYDGYDHIGYDILGNKIPRPSKSALQQLLEKVDDPQALRTIWDPVEHEGHRLSDRDIQLLENIMKNKYPNPEFDPYPDTIEYVQFKRGENPFDMDRPKHQFTPRKGEVMKVGRMVKHMKALLKMGKPLNPPKKPDVDTPYLLWDDNIDDTDPAIKRRQRFHIPPPPVKLPSHAESYNPSPEFLPTQAEAEAFKRIPSNARKDNTFLPRKYNALRHVPVYERTVEDRYRRCLDLFAVTRDTHVKKRYKDPDQLLPTLPSPQDLRPYPCKLGFQYKGHKGAVRSLSVNPGGQYLATGCDDCVVRVFEITSGKVMFAYKTPRPVTSVEWTPNGALNMLGATSGTTLYIFVPRVCATEAVNNETIKFLRAGAVYRSAELQEEVDPDEMVEEETPADEDDPDKQLHLADWKDASPVEAGRDLVLKCLHHSPLTQLSFHSKGDYVAVLSPTDPTHKRGVVIHIISQRKSVNPFKKMKEPALACKFFPSETALFITLSHRCCRIFNLSEQRQVKKLRGAHSHLCCLDIHSGPENRNILLGAQERAVQWYDLDLSNLPYRKLRAHTAAVRDVAYHPRPDAYPLFASASDDGQVHVYHGTVFDDLTKNPLIVPLKILKGHKIVKYLGVQTCKFHPALPWLFTGGADGKCFLWVE